MVDIDPSKLAKNLATFLDPEAFIDIQGQSDCVGQGAYLSQGRFNPLREAWVAGTFANRINHAPGQVKVRLVEEDFPDFEIQIQGAVYPFELTMAIKAGRKMGLEAQQRERAVQAYNIDRKNPLPVKLYRPGEGDESGPLLVSEALRKKASKQYDPKPNILVYANFEANELSPTRMGHCCLPYAGAFTSIWVLHATRVLLISPDHFLGCKAGSWMP